MKPTKNSLLPYYKEIDLTDCEDQRTYVFPDGETVVIENPKTLIVSDNGHRIHDTAGISHYVPYGWIHLWWINPKDRTHGFYCQENLAGDKQ